MIALLYDLIFMLPLAAVGTYFMGTTGLLSQESVLPYIAIFLMLSVCLSMKHLSDRKKYILPGLLLAILLGTILILDKEKRYEILIQSRWILWTVLLTCICYMTGRLVIRYQRAGRILLFVDLAVLLVLLFTKWTIDKWVLLPLFWILTVCFIQETESRWKRSGDTDTRGHLVYILPFPMLLCLIVFLLPVSESPYDWGFAVRLWERAEKAAKHVVSFFQGDKEEYNAQIGFSEEGAFWENSSRKPRELMEITTLYGADSIIYLRGKTFDSFDGRTWVASFQGDPDDAEIDIVETAAAALSRGKSSFTDYMKKTQLSIRLLDFSTRYVFVPLKTEMAGGKIDQIAIQQDGADLIADKSLSYDMVYEISSYRINQDHEAFLELAGEAHVPSAAEWDAAWDYIKPSIDQNDSDIRPAYSDYLSYRERVYDTYLPATQVSERFSDFLGELLDGSTSDYERMLRLERYLAAFTYTTSPGKLPKEVTDSAEFLDYLFFENPRGYCSHFATAFVLAARSLGIPARYVQGYAVPVDRGVEFTVNSAMAHAWPEAYIDGIGWISFEPTPGKARTRYWMVQADFDAQKSGVVPDWHDYAKQEPEVPLPEEEQKRVAFDPKKLLLPLFSALLFLVLFFLGDRLLYGWRMKRLGDTEKFRISCRRNMKLLRFLGYTPAKGETLEEFRNRALCDLSEQALAFTGAMERHIYADTVPDGGMLAVTKTSEESLWKHLQEKKGKRAVFYRIGLSR